MQRLDEKADGMKWLKLVISRDSKAAMDFDACISVYMYSIYYNM
jgi:hypothetical protein